MQQEAEREAAIHHLRRPRPLHGRAELLVSNVDARDADAWAEVLLKLRLQPRKERRLLRLLLRLLRLLVSLEQLLDSPDDVGLLGLPEFVCTALVD